MSITIFQTEKDSADTADCLKGGGEGVPVVMTTRVLNGRVQAIYSFNAGGVPSML
jgi:L-asparaginase/Glu-tRNA(Gln) amidotransferase subunit D